MPTGWSSRISSTAVQDSSLFPLPSPCCPPASSMTACCEGAPTPCTQTQPGQLHGHNAHTFFCTIRTDCLIEVQPNVSIFCSVFSVWILTCKDFFFFYILQNGRKKECRDLALLEQWWDMIWFERRSRLKPQRSQSNVSIL